MPETLKGFVERVTYHNPENGFAVLQVKIAGRDDLVSVVGNTTSVTAGEHVEASGRWVIDRQHGQQKYTGKTMRASLEHLGINEQEWQVFLKDFQASLDKFQVPPTEQKELFAIVESTKGDIVVG